MKKITLLLILGLFLLSSGAPFLQAQVSSGGGIPVKSKTDQLFMEVKKLMGEKNFVEARRKVNEIKQLDVNYPWIDLLTMELDRRIQQDLERVQQEKERIEQQRRIEEENQLKKKREEKWLNRLKKKEEEKITRQKRKEEEKKRKERRIAEEKRKKEEQERKEREKAREERRLADQNQRETLARQKADREKGEQEREKAREERRLADQRAKKIHPAQMDWTRDKRRADQLFEKAKELIKEKEYDLAKNYLEQVLRIDPLYPWVNPLLVVIDQQIQRRDKKAAEQKQLQRKNLKEQLYYQKPAPPLVEEGKQEQAPAVVPQSKEGIAKAHEYLQEGENLLTAGQYEKAIEQFDKALKEDTNLKEAKWRLKIAEKKLKEQAKAIQKKLLAKRKAKMEEEKELKQVEKEKREQQRKRQDGNELAAAAPKRQEIKIEERAWTTALKKESKEEKKELPKKKEENIGFLLQNGAAAYAMKKYDEAIAAYEVALRLAPNSKQAQKGMRKAQEAKKLGALRSKNPEAKPQLFSVGRKKQPAQILQQ